MRTLLCALFIACFALGVCRAQETEDVVAIKHAETHQIYLTIHSLTDGTLVHVTEYGTNLVLRGPKDGVAAIEEVIKKLDVAPPAQKNIDLTVYMVIASTQPSSDPLPAGLEDVAKQLKSVFPYRGYRLLDSFVLRARDGQRGETGGFLPAPSAGAVAKINYSFQFRRVSLPSGDASQGIRVDELNLYLKVPVMQSSGQFNYETATIRTDVDVPEGKKVVIGKTSALDSTDGALFLVISAKVVD